MSRKKPTNNQKSETPTTAEAEMLPVVDEEFASDESDTRLFEPSTDATTETDSQMNKLAEAMAIFKAEAEKNLEGWQRERADFQNYKRRVEREQKDYQRNAELEAMSKLFPIVDDFERALANIPADLQDNPWVNGTALILGKFKKLFDEQDIIAINPENEPFDPYLHQAIAREDSDTTESGFVISTLQKGYRSGDTVLRPALVRVAN